MTTNTKREELEKIVTELLDGPETLAKAAASVTGFIIAREKALLERIKEALDGPGYHYEQNIKIREIIDAELKGME